MSKCMSPNCDIVPPPDQNNLHTVFPQLHVRPRPRPASTDKIDYDNWLKEYDQWGNLRCPCGKGYFCAEHGSWVFAAEVDSGVAAPANEQKDGSCPSRHNEGNYEQVSTYIGVRDATIVPHPGS